MPTNKKIRGKNKSGNHRSTPSRCGVKYKKESLAITPEAKLAYRELMKKHKQTTIWGSYDEKKEQRKTLPEKWL